MTGVTKRGFSFDIPTSTLDDMELVDMLCELDEKNPMQVSALVKKLLGSEQRGRLYDFVRTEAGNVPILEVSRTVAEIFEAMGESGKN